MENIFQEKFWIDTWINDTSGDTCSVHKGFSTPEYWDKASLDYDIDEKEIKDGRFEKVIEIFKRKGLLSDGMTVLDIGCGTGTFAMTLARQGAHVTALDFSEGMLAKFSAAIPSDLEKRITILKQDWHTLNIRKVGWYGKFDLVIAFMSPGMATPRAFFSMMQCSRKGCAIKGWAARRDHPILSALWPKIMGKDLEDNPQSFLYKINLLFALGIFPEITFDTIHWDQDMSVDEEVERQVAFFHKISDKTIRELETIIRPYLESICVNGRIIRAHKGKTATAVWALDKNILSDTVYMLE